ASSSTRSTRRRRRASTGATDPPGRTARVPGPSGSRCASTVGDDPFDGPVDIPIEDALDLHYFVPREIPDVVEAYLEAAAAAGFREVRLIHGRGIGVQREQVRRVLEASPLVERFA